MNIEQGIKQCFGNERQYKTVLMTFDSITLNPSIDIIAEHTSNRDIKSLHQALKQVYSSAQIVQLNGLTEAISYFLQFLERVNKKEPNYEFQLFQQFRTYMLKVRETKELIQKYTEMVIDYSKVDNILSQILVSQNHEEQKSVYNSHRTYEEQVTPKPQTPPIEVLSQPKTQDQECCCIY